MNAQSKLDKWFMRAKDALLFFLGSGALIWVLMVNGVRIAGLPVEVDAMASQQRIDEASNAALERRVLIVETNLRNQTEILQDIKTTQNKMWEKFNRSNG